MSTQPQGLRALPRCSVVVLNPLPFFLLLAAEVGVPTVQTGILPSPTLNGASSSVWLRTWLWALRMHSLC